METVRDAAVGIIAGRKMKMLEEAGLSVVRVRKKVKYLVDGKTYKVIDEDVNGYAVLADDGTVKWIAEMNCEVIV